MAVATRILPNLYRDSVTLMQISAEITGLPGIRQAFLVMATPANLALLADSGLSVDLPEAGVNDLLIAVDGPEDAAQEALDRAQQRLSGGGQAHAESNDAPRTCRRPIAASIEMALEGSPAANLALISVPGEYAAAEAWKALRLGLNVMIFSDNLSLDDEIALKQYADGEHLLVMGPDCGTAILHGVPLAFANRVRRGAIGLVAASGTGLQQVACLIHRLGGGISHAIGTGGRDLHRAVGGRSMLRGIELLSADPETQVIVLISKPPAPEVAQRVLTAAAACGKPVVVNFLGGDGTGTGANLTVAATLDRAARQAVRLVGLTPEPETSPAPGVAMPDHLAALLAERQPQQRYLRGLFSGGTFCFEALEVLGGRLPPGTLFSNVAKEPERLLRDVQRSQGHTLLDLGDDHFTRGRPHPMIDHQLRNRRILQEAGDPETALLVVDVVLGHGAHPDPAAEMAPALIQARTAARAQGRPLAIVGFVCGTELDPQDLVRQEQILADAGVCLAESSTAAVSLAASALAL